MINKAKGSMDSAIDIPFIARLFNALNLSLLTFESISFNSVITDKKLSPVVISISFGSPRSQAKSISDKF